MFKNLFEVNHQFVSYNLTRYFKGSVFSCTNYVCPESLEKSACALCTYQSYLQIEPSSKELGASKDAKFLLLAFNFGEVHAYARARYRTWLIVLQSNPGIYLYSIYKRNVISNSVQDKNFKYEGINVYFELSSLEILSPSTY